MKNLPSIFASAGLLAFTAMFCGCAHTPKVEVKSSLLPAGKIALRNNSASLLYDLLGDEKNVSKILLIKFDRKELNSLIKAVSATAGDGAKQLDKLAKADPTLNLHAIQLPEGETATRTAIGKTKEHELLLLSGEDFEFSLLLTQAEAMSYGWHLAEIAAENSSQPEQVREFKSLGIVMKDLYKQVVVLMRSPPPVK
jgi:hypothetical protein